MAIVSYWSYGKKETGQTLSMAATMISMGADHNFKILGVSTEYQDNTLEEAFFDVKKEKAFQEMMAKEQQKIARATGGVMGGAPMRTNSTMNSGIEGLLKLVQSNRITPEAIKDYAKAILNNRLDILQSPNAKSYNDYVEICKNYRKIIQTANRDYNMIFVDVDKSLPEEIQRELLEISDLVVVNITQNQKGVQGFLDLRAKDELFQKNNVIPLIGRYDKYSRYNKKNITREFKQKRDVCTIAYNTLFYEMATDGMLVDYYLRYRDTKESFDRNKVFVDEARKTCETIIFKLQELQMR